MFPSPLKFMEPLEPSCTIGVVRCSDQPSLSGQVHLEPLHRIERVPWGARMEGAKKQKRRADRVKPSEQDLADELLRAVHAPLPIFAKSAVIGRGFSA